MTKLKNDFKYSSFLLVLKSVYIFLWLLFLNLYRSSLDICESHFTQCNCWNLLLCTMWKFNFMNIKRCYIIDSISISCSMKPMNLFSIPLVRYRYLITSKHIFIFWGWFFQHTVKSCILLGSRTYFTNIFVVAWPQDIYLKVGNIKVNKNKFSDKWSQI